MSKMTEFLDRRLARRFRTLDDDGNGFIERCDFETSAERLAKEFGHGSDSRARQQLIELTLGLWDHLRRVADKNVDGRIGLDEYKAAFAAGLLETPESFDQGYVPFLDAIMDIADGDGDGRLTVTDEIRWTKALMHLPEQDAREAFRRIDADGDGFITVGDLLAAIRGYYFDDSADSPGHWLLGPLDS
ncbi:EF-hand domain-containing protein [Nannocystis radixulma]|uniref:EF-hand domain-containing protein n=1 Tax=Nannocystis radixulma TaxID=2995305 RepID=A0ABT5B6D7_9BACT|nr:EF-hand domain-containing protein [Nannocystis radixulma]MDC0669288.1 EF-hand domain-containing protein [Nannocystis radixulma]